MKFIKTFILNSAALLLCLTLLSGCAEKENGGTVIIPAQNSETAKNEIIPGGTVRVPIIGNPASLHPLFVKEAQTRNVFSMIFEKLISFDDNMEPASCLAESWKYNEDDGTWVIKLRSNVHWHGDLGEMDASDAAFTINTVLANPDSIYYPALSTYVESAEGYDTTLIIHPKVKSYLTVYALNIPVIPENYYSGKSKGTLDTPMGSGCFAVEGMNLSDKNKITLVANSKWWKKLPYIEKVQVFGYESTEAALEDFKNGNLDCVPTSLRTTEIYEILSGVNKVNYLSKRYMFLGFNLSRQYVSDVNFRKAVSYGINRTDIINNVYLTKASGTEQPIYNDSSLSSTSVVMYDYNVSTAKDLLENLGYTDSDSDGYLESNGRKIELSLAVVYDAEDPVRYETAEKIAEDLGKIGISVTVNSYNSGDFSGVIGRRDYDLIIGGYYLSETPSLRFAFDIDGRGNLFNYSSSEMNEAFNKIASSADMASLKSSMLDFQNILAKDLPQLGLFFEMNTFLYKENLSISGIKRESNVYSTINNWYFNA